MKVKSVDWILEQLDGELQHKFAKVVDETKECLTAIPIGNPTTFSIPHVKSLLKISGQNPKSGDVARLSDSLMTMAGNSKLIL